MYYKNITDEEICLFHNLKVPNFTIKLTDALSSGLFKVETIISNSIYKIIPLFYTGEINSSNPNDRILDNQCIICEKSSKETYLTFISDETAEIQDYQNFATYYNIGSSLTTAQYNSIVSLLRHNTVHTLDFRILEEVTGNYGRYLFDLSDVTFLDTGVLITSETISAEPKVKLVDNLFKYSTYTLKLNVLHYTGVNILDDITQSDYKVIDTLEIELTPNEWVDIPVEDLEQGYIISFDANITITHDKTEIHMINGLEVSSPTPIIQTGENAEIYAQLIDYNEDNYNLTDASGNTVYFYEVLTPDFTLNAEPDIIQIGETSDITCKVKDSDGSIAKNKKIYFYKKEES